MDGQFSNDFKSQYREDYGPSYRAVKPDFSRCAEAVFGRAGWGSHQCTRKNGHGPHGAWCKAHNPEAVKAKRDAQQAKWQAAWDQECAFSDAKAALEPALRQIAAGHNDPRGLAESVIAALDAATPKGET